jgi:hypothetical protein
VVEYRRRNCAGTYNCRQRGKRPRRLGTCLPGASVRYGVSVTAENTARRIGRAAVAKFTVYGAIGGSAEGIVNS